MTTEQTAGYADGCNALRPPRMEPLVRVLHVISNDGVIRRERLACGHILSRFSYERSAERRRCAKCFANWPVDLPDNDRDAS